MNAHTTTERAAPPRFRPSPGSLAAAAAAYRAITPVSRTAAFVELISLAADEFDKLSMTTGNGECYVSDVYAAEAAMLDAVLCQKPECTEDVLLVAIAGMVRAEALHGHIDDPKVSASANAIGLAFRNMVQFLTMDNDGALWHRMESFPGMFGIAVSEQEPSS